MTATETHARINRDVDYHALNAELNLLDSDGNMQLDKDKEAVRQYFLEHVNQNTVFFHTLREKIDYLIDNGYYEEEVITQYSFDFVKSLFQRAYAFRHRFDTFLGAYKYYNAYTLKTFDGKRYLERFEDRVTMVALYLARGNEEHATGLLDQIISGRFQPATPTFANAGKKQRGELVSCFLMRVEDNMESIGRSINSSLQLSKRGGGVALNLTNLREQGAPIKKIEGQSSGVVPVMKMLEDAFSYANQLGSRQGAGAAYLHAHHPDIMRFLDTKRENADEKVRIKTLSLGVIVPDITFELAKSNEDMYLFSPYDVEREYGVPFSEVDITAEYHKMVDNKNIAKTKIKAREFFQTVAEIQFESGYPYMLFIDAANRANPIHGRVSMSNLCSEILQVSTPSEYNADLTYATVGRDISCNLGSLNIARAFDAPDFEEVIEYSMRALSAVSDMSDISSVPSIAEGNRSSRAVGLGAMNLHGFLARESIHYDSPEAVDFTTVYFSTVAYYTLKASSKQAKETGSPFYEFEKSDYASGKFFDKYLNHDYGTPQTPKVRELMKKSAMKVPTIDDWSALKDEVMKHGLYNAYRMATAPTGSISYVNGSTSSIHPITSKIEARKEGKIGRVYYPAMHMTNENTEYYRDAYEIGYQAVLDVYAAASEHHDQGLSLTTFWYDTATTRDLNKLYIEAFKRGIKTLYYARIKNTVLKGTDAKPTAAPEANSDPATSPTVAPVAAAPVAAPAVQPNVENVNNLNLVGIAGEVEDDDCVSCTL